MPNNNFNKTLFTHKKRRLSMKDRPNTSISNNNDRRKKDIELS